MDFSNGTPKDLKLALVNALNDPAFAEASKEGKVANSDRSHSRALVTRLQRCVYEDTQYRSERCNPEPLQENLSKRGHSREKKSGLITLDRQRS